MIAGRPSPRRRQKAQQSGGVEYLRSSPKPRAVGSSPVSMASGVDGIAAPGGT
jgi:hypothetical protein